MANFLDRVIGAVSPERAARRASARLRLAGLEAAATGLRYAAGGHDARTQGWYTPQTDAVGAADGKLETLRSRHRSLVRDNPWAARAVQVIVDATVGTGAQPQALAEDRADADAAEAAWREWAASTACDADGVHDFAGMQALAMRTIVESGGVLARRRVRERPEDVRGMPLPLQVQLLEPDHLSDVKRQYGGNPIVQGVEFDGIGRRAAYWLTKSHPGAAAVGLTGLADLEGRRVPASEIAHAFRQERPGQVQGVPWGAPAMLTLRELDNYADAELVRKRLAACFTAFVTGADAPGPSTIGGTAAKRAESLEPGMIQYLADGETVDFAAPQDSPTYDAFVTSVLRAVAVGYGVPYMALTGDLTKVNFSSGRMGGVEFWRSVETWRSRVLVTQFLSPIWRWVQEAALATGRVDRIVPARWTAPGRILVDPRAEGIADHAAIRNGTKTLLQVLAERGRDPEEHLREIQRANELLDEFGLVLDSDPRRAPAPGTSSGAQGAGDSSGKAEGDGEDGEGDEEESRRFRPVGA